MTRKGKKGLPVDGQIERVQLYAERYSNRQDIYSGEPFEGQDLEDWYTNILKSKIGKHLSDYPMVLENNGERLAEEIYQVIVEMIEELEIDIASFLAEEIRDKVDEINEKAVASLEPEDQKNIDHEGFPSLKDK